MITELQIEVQLILNILALKIMPNEKLIFHNYAMCAAVTSKVSI